jgi:hypothetical protein
MRIYSRTVSSISHPVLSIWTVCTTVAVLNLLNSSGSDLYGVRSEHPRRSGPIISNRTASIWLWSCDRCTGSSVTSVLNSNLKCVSRSRHSRILAVAAARYLLRLLNLQLPDWAIDCPICEGPAKKPYGISFRTLDQGPTGSPVTQAYCTIYWIHSFFDSKNDRFTRRISTKRTRYRICLFGW